MYEINAHLLIWFFIRLRPAWRAARRRRGNRATTTPPRVFTRDLAIDGSPAFTSLLHAAVAPASRHLFSTARGWVIRSYPFGRRFTTRGSKRSGRSGLTTSLASRSPRL